MTEFAKRVKMRALIEDPSVDHDIEIGSDLVELDDARWTPVEVSDRVAHLEREDTDNPIAQTMQLRKDLALVVHGPSWHEATGRRVLLRLPLTGSGPYASDQELHDPREN